MLLLRSDLEPLNSPIIAGHRSIVLSRPAHYPGGSRLIRTGQTHCSSQPLQI